MMTNQEAIEILKIERDHMVPTLLPERIEAMDMAISALQAQDVPDTNVGDMISRHAAIAEFSCCELTPDGGIDANYAIDFLEQMSSAQSEPSQVARDIATIIENEQDMRVIQKNAEPQWIPCSERLPEIKQRVLITYNTEDGLKTDVTWYDKHGFLLSGEVSAWMPMMEPYREEGGE